MSYQRIQIVAFCFLILLIAFAGPFLGVLHALKMDPEMLEIWVGGLAALCAILFTFKYHIMRGVTALQTRLSNMEDVVLDDYPALPAGHEPLLEAQDIYYPTEEEAAPQVSPQPDEPALELGPKCPLPFSSALNPTLILERPGAEKFERSVATRLYIELLSGFSMGHLVVTMNPSYASLLRHNTNAWLAGHPDAKEERSAWIVSRRTSGWQGQEARQAADGRYASVTERNARAFGKKILEVDAQVVLDLSTYQDGEQAARILLGVLTGICEYKVAHAGGYFIFLCGADAWLPNEKRLSRSTEWLIAPAELLAQIKGQVYKILTQEEPNGLFLYLSTDQLLPMDLRIVRRCHLWTLNMLPDEEDVPFIAHHTGLSDADLACLDHHAILADTTTRLAMEVPLYLHQTPHEEPSGKKQGNALSDLAGIPEEEEFSRLGKAQAEAGLVEEEESSEEEPVSATANTHHPFSMQFIAYGLALWRSDPEFLTETALRRPPTTRTVLNTDITFSQLAQELGVKNAFTNKDLLGHKQAEHLAEVVQSLDTEQRQTCEQMIQSALSAIAARRRPGLPPLDLAQIFLNNQTRPGASRWPIPPLDLLRASGPSKKDNKTEIYAKARALQEALDGFQVPARVMEEIQIGPRIISFGILPTEKDGRKTKVEQITRLKKDLQRVLQAKQIRILDPIPGTDVVGIEIPNPFPSVVRLREILESPEFQIARSKSRLMIALGRDVAGNIRFFDLEKAPHVLIGGASGSGKSVFAHTILVSLVMGATPEEVRFVLVDPKMVELKPFYNGIPHLLRDVITDVTEVAGMLESVRSEMNRRYKRFAELGVRNLEEYRQLRASRRSIGDDTLPNIPAYVVLIDEMANIMLNAKDEVEEILCDLIALGRAAGVHLILATQRPVVEVVTGLIKANITTRIGFAVPQAVDSRVILDQSGAETLLGRGDMLYLDETLALAERIQSAFTETDEVKGVTNYWKQAKPLTGNEEVQPIGKARQMPLDLDLNPVEPRPAAQPQDDQKEPELSQAGQTTSPSDPLAEHIEAFLRGDPVSIKPSDLENDDLYRFVKPWSCLQEELGIQDIMFTFGLGQPRAKRLVTWLERDGIVSKDPGAGRKRQVLRTPAEEPQPPASPVSEQQPEDQGVEAETV